MHTKKKRTATADKAVDVPRCVLQDDGVSKMDQQEDKQDSAWITDWGQQDREQIAGEHDSTIANGWR